MILTLEDLQKLKINELFSKILVNRYSLYGFPIYLQAAQYMMEDAEAKTIFTPEEIIDYKTHIQCQLNVHIAHNIDTCFKINIKSPYNMIELNTITHYIYNNMTIYSEVIILMFKTIQNYYGRGKFKLNTDDPEEFITNVITQMAHRNYNPDIIRAQIKTVRMMNMLVKNIIKVIDIHILTLEGSKYKEIINTRKDTRLKMIKTRTSSATFGKKSIDELKLMFKERDKQMYKCIIDIVDGIGQDYSNLYSLFLFLYQDKACEIEYPVFEKIYALKKSALEKFVMTNHSGLVPCIVQFESTILYNNLLVDVFEAYLTNTKLHKIITEMS